MKKLICLIAFCFSFAAKAGVVKVCVTDMGGCILAANQTLWVSDSLKSDAQTVAEFSRAGYAIASLTPLVEELLSPLVIQTVNIDLTKAQEEVDSLGDDFGESAFGCAGAFLGCVLATDSAILAPPISMYLVKVGCGLAGGQCAHTLIRYQKWQKKKEELEDLKKKEAARRQTPPQQASLADKAPVSGGGASAAGAATSLDEICKKVKCNEGTAKPVVTVTDQ